jgi:hypothetical protein
VHVPSALIALLRYKMVRGKTLMRGLGWREVASLLVDF